MAKCGRRLSQTRRTALVRKWPVMKWYIMWSDYVRKQKRFKRFLVSGAPGLDIKTAELWQFDRSQFPDAR